MIQFYFNVNMSFLKYKTRPITVPRSQVDYAKLERENLYVNDMTIIFPTGKSLSGQMYHGVASYGPYYQIKMNGYDGDASIHLTKDQLLLVKVKREGLRVTVELVNA